MIRNDRKKKGPAGLHSKKEGGKNRHVKKKTHRDSIRKENTGQNRKTALEVKPKTALLHAKKGPLHHQRGK